MLGGTNEELLSNLITSSEQALSSGGTYSAPPLLILLFTFR